MSSAGKSAEAEAQHALFEADKYERLARENRSKARRYRAGAEGERRLGSHLEHLTELGWRVLADRRWGRRANVDFLLVGPAGVVVADAKNWAEPRLEGGSLFRGDECVDDELEKNLRLADEVAEAVAELGIAPASVMAVMVFDRHRLDHELQGVHLVGAAAVAAWLCRRPRRFDGETIAAVTECLEEAFPAHDGQRRSSAVRPKVKATPRVAEPTTEQVSLIDVEDLTDALVEAALAGPIEEWMTFLHPSQRRLVTASFRGPARVRGSAGTGKTVVGLHRAAHLAARSSGGTIYFVTFVRTLPQVLRSLATRLAPSAIERIQFTGLHRLARVTLDRAGMSAPLDLKRVETAFALAWLKCGRGSVLENVDSRPSYWKEEIDYVIKGRGLTEFGDYAGLQRTGRGNPMQRPHREAMWDLYIAYEEHLESAGSCDFNDWLIQARDLVRDGVVDLECSGVIVDEVQDLTMVGLQFLREVAGEGANRLMVIGDGQQSVYPGGFSLADAGVDVRGRATVLEVNYRNTAQIIEAARRVVGDDEFEDLDEGTQSGDRQIVASRQGDAPVVVDAPVGRESVLRTVEHLRSLSAAGTNLGNVAVLTMSAKDAERYEAALGRAGIEAQSLLDYDGVTSARVKVGTVKRAKGLEFAHVLLPELVSTPRQWDGESDESFEERARRHRRETYVAMTRARDGLWVCQAR